MASHELPRPRLDSPRWIAGMHAGGARRRGGELTWPVALRMRRSSLLPLPPAAMSPSAAPRPSCAAYNRHGCTPHRNIRRHTSQNPVVDKLVTYAAHIGVRTLGKMGRGAPKTLARQQKQL